MVSDAQHEADAGPSPSSAEERTGSRRGLQWMSLYVLLSVVLGAVGAVVWRLIVHLPAYTVQSDGKAVTTQAGITQVFQSDAWFAGIGAVSGLLLGLLAWRWFRTLGWLVPVLAGLAALVAGVACWQLGSLLGPGPFDQRLAAANPGDVVPIGLELHAPVALALWVMMAQLPVLIAASLLRDPEDPPVRSAGGATAIPLTDDAVSGEDTAGASFETFLAPGDDVWTVGHATAVPGGPDAPAAVSAPEAREGQTPATTVDSTVVGSAPRDDPDPGAPSVPHGDSANPVRE